MSASAPSTSAIDVLVPETVAALLRRHDIDPTARYLAVAVNGAVVRRAEWDQHVLRAGDTVEVVRPFQGG